MGFYENLGGISGAALGYIHGNIRGAKLGYRLGYQLTQKKSMPAIRGSKRSKSKTAGSKRLKRSNGGWTPISHYFRRAFFKKSGRSGRRLKGKKSIKRVEPIHASAMHSGVTGAVVKVRRSGIKYRKYSKRMPQWSVNWSFQNHMIPAAGRQTVVDAVQIGTAQQFVTNTAVPLTTTDVSPCAFFNLNPNQKITGSSGVMPAGVSPVNDKIILKSYESRWMLTSLSGTAAIVTIYVLTPKVATNKLPATLWGTAVLDEAQTIVSQTFPAPGGGSWGTLGAEDFTNLYSKPQDFQRFRDYWKVKAVKDVRLEGNATEMVNFDFKIHKTIDKSKIYEMINQFGGGANNVYIPGVTHAIMLVCHGVPVIDTTINTNHIVTTGSPNVAFTFSQKVHLHGVPCKATDRISTFLSYSQIPANATQANQAIITEIDVPATVAASTQQ